MRCHSLWGSDNWDPSVVLIVNSAISSFPSVVSIKVILIIGSCYASRTKCGIKVGFTLMEWDEEEWNETLF